MITLPPLPFSPSALAPRMSSTTLELHYGRHHQGYVDRVNDLIKGTEHAKMALEEIVLTSQGELFNQAAQVLNHNLFWQCLSPTGEEKPNDELLKAINRSFGTFTAFKEEFTEKAKKLFGSGWVWLANRGNGHLMIMPETNAGNPICQDATPLLACDVWEHAYYIDYQNNRDKYLEAYWNLVNWEFVSRRFKSWK